MRPRILDSNSTLRGAAPEAVPAAKTGAAQAVPGGISIAHLAHELNSLLDGSMRCLSLAEQAMNSEGGARTVEGIVTKLRLARDGMREMADVLDRAMKTPAADIGVFARDLPLVEQARWIMQTLMPLAQQHRIKLIAHINPTAGRLRSATLGPVILNGLRNAIDACALVNRPSRAVELSATINTRDELVLLITDSGPGVPLHLTPGATTKPQGHGLGLDLCRRIVSDLGGRVELTDIPGLRGAVLRITAPVKNMSRP